ncbi:MAG: cyclase family protein [Bryobacterales bacterium]|nr:cyclase family protein [Bryobacterales bacterium]
MPRLIDLSHTLVDGMPGFPGDPELRIATQETIASTGYNLALLRTTTHQGTHVDAPFHFFDDGQAIDRISLDRFFGPAALIDLAPGGELPPGARLTEETFAPWREVFRPGARVIYRTGWSRRFGSPEFFQDCPSLTLDAARWIAGRGTGLLGMDTPTPSTDWLECHRALLGAGVLIVEALANLEQLPPRFTFIGFPLKIGGRDGSPIRAVALVEDS